MTLEIMELTKQDFGVYRCVAKNSLGETDGRITLHGKFIRERDGRITLHGKFISETDERITLHGKFISETDGRITPEQKIFFACLQF